MELRVVIEALRVLPERMRRSTPAKGGIEEWTGNRIKRNWRTGNGTPIAKKSLWQKLIQISKKHARINWSWVKAHSGILLNECADLLATRGIFGCKSQNRHPQHVTSLGEDTDNEECELSDDEETLGDERRAEHPPARTYLWK
jgi:ribonuclease HI